MGDINAANGLVGRYLDSSVPDQSLDQFIAENFTEVSAPECYSLHSHGTQLFPGLLVV